MTDEPRSIRYCSSSGYMGTTGEHDYFTECPICFALTVPERADAHARKHYRKDF